MLSGVGAFKGTAAGFQNQNAFPLMDDAKTLSQADGAVERNNLLAEVQGLPGASNETKMSETEAFLAYCQKDDEDDD